MRIALLSGTLPLLRGRYREYILTRFFVVEGASALVGKAGHIHVSTRDAFSQIKPRRPQRSLKETIQLPVEEWREYMMNDFEESVFPLNFLHIEK